MAPESHLFPFHCWPVIPALSLFDHFLTKRWVRKTRAEGSREPSFHPFHCWPALPGCVFSACFSQKDGPERHPGLPSHPGIPSWTTRGIPSPRYTRVIYAQQSQGMSLVVHTVPPMVPSVHHRVDGFTLLTPTSTRVGIFREERCLLHLRINRPSWEKRV